MVITVQDILLMDIGTKAYTEFDWDEDVVNYRMENIEALTGNWLVGHVHSHNTMDVFFSGTDMSELNDNCPNHNFYLSLIVNNFMEMTAKIAFTAEPIPIQTSYTCLDELGKEYVLKLEAMESETKMFLYSCDVKLPVREIKVDESFTERLTSVGKKIAAKAERAKIDAAALAAKNASINKSVVPMNAQKTIAQSLSEWEKFAEEKEVVRVEETFLCFVCRLGQSVKNDTIDAALEDIEISQIVTKDLVLSVAKNFDAYYDTFFRNSPSFRTPESLIGVLQHMIFILEEQAELFDVAKELAEVLKEYGAKFESTLQIN